VKRNGYLSKQAVASAIATAAAKHVPPQLQRLVLLLKVDVALVLESWNSRPVWMKMLPPVVCQGNGRSTVSGGLVSVE